jgi:ubiquinone/menaquinone biosynthesis C-methylase UbiE
MPLVLDIGCGTGLLNKFLIAHEIPIGTLIGMDLSLGMLHHARRYGFPVLQGDMAHLPFKNSIFDAVVMVTVLRIINEDEGGILSEIYRVLQPHGSLFFSILQTQYDSSLDSNLFRASFTTLSKKECGQDIGFLCKKY